MSKILIVEDEEVIADLEKDYLELSGFEVEITNNGKDGLDQALKGDFSLVIFVLKCVKKFVKNAIFLLLWYLQRRMTLIKSVDLVLVQTITLQNHSAQANWLPG